MTYTTREILYCLLLCIFFYFVFLFVMTKFQLPKIIDQ
ncbi:hypothetical protein X975_11256, partial [Stegodyphus mimosarum]